MNSASISTIISRKGSDQNTVTDQVRKNSESSHSNRSFLQKQGYLTDLSSDERPKVKKSAEQGKLKSPARAQPGQ